MLAIDYIREHPDKVKQAASHKQLDPGIVDQVLALDKKRRALIQKVESLREQRNLATKQIAILKQSQRQQEIVKVQQLKTRLKNYELKLRQTQEEYNTAMLAVPNPPHPDVPIGSDESGNQVIKRWGKRPKFKFPIKDHVELAAAEDLLDLERGVKIGGFRGYFLKNDLVMVEQQILRLALRHMIAAGFTPMAVPWLVKRDAMVGTGYFPWGEDDHYQTQDKTYLSGTSEVSLTSYYMGETLNEADLPIKLVGISPCFRREIGTYGKDTRGIVRVHQFMKVEQVVLCRADEKEQFNWHEQMLGYSEAILKELKLPYQVVLMCTGDMGAGQYKKYDIETWFPAQNKYRETHSASCFNDFQSRRLNIKYRTKTGDAKHVYTLNNTVIATPRILAAIIENYQTKDSQIAWPKILKDY